jgi:hypothetical protein
LLGNQSHRRKRERQRPESNRFDWRNLQISPPPASSPALCTIIIEELIARYNLTFVRCRKGKIRSVKHEHVHQDRPLAQVYF